MYAIARSKPKPKIGLHHRDITIYTYWENLLLDTYGEKVRLSFSSEKGRCVFRRNHETGLKQGLFSFEPIKQRRGELGMTEGRATRRDASLNFMTHKRTKNEEVTPRAKTEIRI